MNSKLLESMGLGGIDIGIVLLVLIIVLFIVTVMAIVLSIELCKLTKRYNKFCGGKTAGNLEKEIGAVFADNAAIKDQVDKNRRDIKHIYRRLEPMIQKVGLTKYDAFDQMGGKLSFSLCMLDEKDNGFILNSVHGTDGCYTYSKEIKAGECKLTLGQEEINALKMAMHE